MLIRRRRFPMGDPKAVRVKEGSSRRGPVWRAPKRLIKDARSPQFASQIGSPTPRFAAPSASLTAAPSPAPEAPSSIGKTDKGGGHDNDFYDGEWGLRSGR